MPESMMSIQEYAAVRDFECSHGQRWGTSSGLWAIAAVIVIAFFVYAWQKGCNEKVQFATGLARLDGRIDAIEPAVTAHGNNLYQLNGVVAATVQGTKDMKECFGNQLFELNEAVFYNPSRRGRNSCGCNNGCGNREFRQSSTYNLASTQVTVDETCRN